MKRVKKIVVAATFAVVLALCLLCSCTGKMYGIKEYDATPTQFAYEIDDSIAFTDIFDSPVDNKSRGFRGETYITLGRNEAYPGSGEPYLKKLEKEYDRLQGDGIKLMQVYVYLIEYYNTDIPQSAFDQLTDYLEEFTKRDIKILLRFAYETYDGQKKGPRTKDIQRHCLQLKGYIEKNAELFDRSVYAAQMGLIGLWGEGHGSAHRLDVYKVAQAFADMIPEDVPLMARTPQMLEAMPHDLQSRFGMHEDYVIGFDDPWVAIATTDEKYQSVINKCKYAVTDGEMPWGRANASIDGINLTGVVKTCVDFGMTSFSLAHNYTEEGEHYLKKWQTEYLTEEALIKNKFPYNPALLVDGKISGFDYLKYHLGYQLVASNLSVGDGKASFMITNYGFAGPYGYEMNIYVDGKPIASEEGYKYTDLLQFCQKVYTIPYTGGEIAVEFVNTRDNNDKIRLFNKIDFTDGRNIILK